MASARRAAEYGAKVAVVESGRLGGTCVNVGCVPKKVMWNAAFVKEVIEGAADYGHDFDHASYSFDWGKVKASRDSYVTRLNGIYERNLDGSGVTSQGRLSFCCTPLSLQQASQQGCRENLSRLRLPEFD